LGGFARVRRRFADVEPVVPGHLLELFEGAKLFGDLFTQANYVFCRMAIIEFGLVAFSFID